jgi:hypothetical protein
LTARSAVKSIRSVIEIIEVTVLCQVYLDIITRSQKCTDSQGFHFIFFPTKAYFVYQKLNETKRFLDFTLQAGRFSIEQSVGTIIIVYFLWHCSPARAMASSFTSFLDHTKRRATVGRTPLDE